MTGITDTNMELVIKGLLSTYNPRLVEKQMNGEEN